MSAQPVPDLIDAAELLTVLDGRWREVRERAREMAADPRFAVRTGEDTETQRANVLMRMGTLAEGNCSRMGFPAQYGGLDDVGGAITAFEMLATGDLSLLVKAGVQ